MKKNFIYTTLLTLASFMLASCGDEESLGLSRITYYPTIEIQGANPLLNAKGSQYTEPGYISLLNGEDVTDKVVVTGLPDTNVSGDYTVKYTTVKNEDGFGASASRRVIVADANDPVEGLYWVQPDSYRDRAGTQVKYNSTYPIVILNNGDGTYSVDDMLGGWYYYRAGYGSSYGMQGIISIDANGAVSLLESIVPGWGDSHSDFTGSFDASTGTMTLKTVYAEMYFIQTWIKQQ